MAEQVRKQHQTSNHFRQLFPIETNSVVLLPVILAKPGAEWASSATRPRYNEELERGENQPGENGKATHVWRYVQQVQQGPVYIFIEMWIQLEVKNVNLSLSFYNSWDQNVMMLKADPPMHGPCV